MKTARFLCSDVFGLCSRYSEELILSNLIELLCVYNRDQYGICSTMPWLPCPLASSTPSLNGISYTHLLPKEKRTWTLSLDATWYHFNHHCCFFDSCHKCYEPWQIYRNIDGVTFDSICPKNVRMFAILFCGVRPKKVRKSVNPERIGELDQGSLNYPFGGIKQCKCMLYNLEGFPIQKMHCWDWYCSDPWRWLYMQELLPVINIFLTSWFCRSLAVCIG